MSLCVFASSCQYAERRWKDFGDIWRLEANFGLGLQAHAVATELVHVGAGSSRHHSGGLLYGTWETRWQVEDHFPLSYIYTLIDPDVESLHQIDFSADGKVARHRCYVLVPSEYHGGDLTKPEIHWFDFEVGCVAGIFGVEVGFSLGEFVDWILGFFTLDIADDDEKNERERKKLWNEKGHKEPTIPK